MFPDNIHELLGRSASDVVFNISIINPPSPTPSPFPSPAPSPIPTPTPPPNIAENEPFWERLGNFFLNLFVPGEDFFQNHFNDIEARLQTRLPFQSFITTIARLGDVSGHMDDDYSVFDISFEFNGQPMRFDIGRHIAPYLRHVRTMVTGLYVIFLAYYNYRQIMFLIRGTNYQSMSGGKC